jgi:hypothetical protein
MLLEHALVVHLVDVIARKNDHVLRLFRADGINVLIDRVSRPHVPVLADPLHGRQDFNELANLAAKNIPAFADLAIERERFVLREDEDPAQSGIDTVR